MKLLAFSDFHGLRGFINHYVDVKKKIDIYQPDILLLCGDLQDGGFERTRGGFERTLENRLRRLNFSRIFFVWGNSEEQLNINHELRHASNLHLRLQEHGGIHFLGLGGDEIDLKQALPKAESILESSSCEQLVIVSHAPPHEALDLCNDGRDVGVPELREFIEKYHPLLVACGHIHENAQKTTKIGRSLICNVGRKGVLFKIEKNHISTQMLE